MTDLLPQIVALTAIAAGVIPFVLWVTQHVQEGLAVFSLLWPN